MIIDRMAEPTVADVLRAGADWIEEYGWFRMVDDKGTSTNCACAVTSVVYAVPYHPYVRLDALDYLCAALDLPGSHEEPGVAIGIWNDAQVSGDVVIAKMREVADSLEH